MIKKLKYNKHLMSCIQSTCPLALYTLLKTPLSQNVSVYT